jgi:hypothetical protein
VFFIEHKEGQHMNNTLDNMLFIMWDNRSQTYYLCGKRLDSPSMQYPPYALNCSNVKSLSKFIECVVGQDELCSVTLYNFNNIDDMAKEDLTYEFFLSMVDKQYEICGYDGINSSSSYFYDLVKMLSSFYNDYSNYTV